MKFNTIYSTVKLEYTIKGDCSLECTVLLDYIDLLEVVVQR